MVTTKYQLVFFLTQALYCNGDQKQKLPSLYCTGLFGLHLGHFWKKCQLEKFSVTNFTKQNPPFLSNKNLTLPSEMQLSQDARKNTVIDLINLLITQSKSPSLSTPDVLCFLCPHQKTKKSENIRNSSVNDKTFDTLEATVFFHSKD